MTFIFLNTQARFYYESCEESPGYNAHILRIQELFRLVPEDEGSPIMA